MTECHVMARGQLDCDTYDLEHYLQEFIRLSATSTLKGLDSSKCIIS